MHNRRSISPSGSLVTSRSHSRQRPAFMDVPGDKTIGIIRCCPPRSRYCALGHRSTARSSAMMNPDFVRKTGRLGKLHSDQQPAANAGGNNRGAFLARPHSFRQTGIKARFMPAFNTSFVISLVKNSSVWCRKLKKIGRRCYKGVQVIRNHVLRANVRLAFSRIPGALHGACPIPGRNPRPAAVNAFFEVAL